MPRAISEISLYFLEMKQGESEYFDLKKVIKDIDYHTKFNKLFYQRAYDVMESEGYIEKNPKSKREHVRLTGKGLMRVEERFEEELFDDMITPEDSEDD